MAEVQTPTGQTIFVPDDWSNFMQPPTPGAAAPEYPMPGAPNVPSLPQLPPAPPPPPPPPKTIGPGMPPVEETTGPTPQATPLPSVVDQLNSPAPGPAPLTEVPATLPTDAQLKKQSALQAKADAAQAKAEAQKQAWLNSAEGQIQTAGQQQQQSVENRSQIADKQGDLEAAQMANIAAIKQQGIQDADKIRAEAEAARLEADKQRAIKVDEVNKLVDANKNFKIDDNRRWNNLSTGRKILAGISVALSGLGDALMRKSGPNAALGIIHDAIQEDVNAQMRERENLGKQLGFARNSLDDYIRATGEKQHAIALKMAEEKERVADQVDATSAMYASPMAKLRGQAISEQLRGEAAAIKEKVGAGIFDRDQKRQEAARQQQSINIAGYNASIAAKNQALNERQFAWTQEKDRAAAMLEAQKLLQKGDPAQAKLVQERAIGGDFTPIKDKDGNVVDVKIDLMKQKDGSVWIPNGTEADISRLHKQHAATIALLGTLDQIRREGPEWLSDTKNSDKLQRMKQLMGDARLQAIAAKDLGVPTGHDIELAENFIGTSDPTQMRSSIAGLNQGRDSLVRDHNALLHTAGLDHVWKPPDLGALQEPTPTGADKNWQDTLSGKADRNTQIQTLQSVGALAQSADPKVRDANLKLLEEAAQSAPDADVKATAQQYLKAFRPLAGPGPQIAQPVQPEPPPTGDVTPVAGGSQYAATGTPKLPPAILNYDPYKQIATVRMANGTTQQMPLADAYKVAPPPGLRK